MYNQSRVQKNFRFYIFSNLAVSYLSRNSYMLHILASKEGPSCNTLVTLLTVQKLAFYLDFYSACTIFDRNLELEFSLNRDYSNRLNFTSLTRTTLLTRPGIVFSSRLNMFILVNSTCQIDWTQVDLTRLELNVHYTWLNFWMAILWKRSI